MDSVENIFEKIQHRHLMSMKEWVACFEPKDNATEERYNAMKEIKNTLSNQEHWNDRSGNFLLRLISDDENGYPNKNDKKWRPRVQLAMAFIEHMAEFDEHRNFLETTLNVHELAAQPTNSGDENADQNDRDNGDLLVSNNDLQNPVNEQYGNASENIRDRATGDQPADNNEKRKRRNGLIHEAAKSGQCAILEKFHLLTKENVNYLNNIGERAIHLAAKFEHPEDVRILLGAGAEFKVCVVHNYVTIRMRFDIVET